AGLVAVVDAGVDQFLGGYERHVRVSPDCGRAVRNERGEDLRCRPQWVKHPMGRPMGQAGACGRRAVHATSALQPLGNLWLPVLRPPHHNLPDPQSDRTDPAGGGSTALPDNARSMSGPRPEQARNLVLVLNHGGDALLDLEAALRNAGYEVRQTSSFAESNRVLEQDRPDAVALSPLGLLRSSVEIELLEVLQSQEDPLPVL